MNKLFILSLCLGLLLSSLQLVAQDSYFKVSKTDYVEEIQAMVGLEDGSTMVATNSYAVNGFSVQRILFLQKFSAEGDLIWSKKPPELEENSTEVNSIVQTAEGHLIVIGDTKEPLETYTQPFLAKFDLEGQLLWKKVLPYQIDFTKVIETSLGELVAIGNIKLKDYTVAMLLLRFDQEGAILDIHIYSDQKEKHIANDIVETEDAYYLAGSYPTEAVRESFALVKLSRTFEFQWVKNYHESEPLNIISKAAALEIDKEGNLIIAGREWWYKKETGGAKILKVDTAGIVIWKKSFGLNGKSEIMDLAITPQNQYLALTEIQINRYKISTGLLTFDANGNQLQKQVWERPTSDRPTQLETLKGGGYIFGGIANIGTGNDALLLGKLDKNAQLDWEKFKEAPKEGN